MTIFLASLCKTHFKHLEIWLNYLKVVFYSRFCTKCDEFPVNLKFTNCLCKRYKFRKHVYFPISNFHALKECLVRKEKYALPPYCKGVSKKQTLNVPSVCLMTSIAETVGPLNLCIIKDFTAKLRISDQKHFLCNKQWYRSTVYVLEMFYWPMLLFRYDILSCTRSPTNINNYKIDYVSHIIFFRF